MKSRPTFVRPRPGPAGSARPRGLGPSEALRERMRRTERQLESARAVLQELRQFEQIFDNVGDGLLIVDAGGYVQRANRQAVRMLDRSLGDLLGQSLPVLLGPGTQSELGQAIDAVLGQRLLQVVVEATPTRNGTLRCTVSALSVLEGLAVVDLHDIGELKSMQDEKRQHEAITALAGVTAHKLNQPLTAVIGYVQLLRRMDRERRHDDALVRVEEAAQEIADLVREIGRITKFQMQGYAGRNQILKLGD